MATVHEIVFDCERAAALARFWAAAIDGYEVRPYDEAEIERLAAKGLTPETDPVVMVDGPGPMLCFQEGVETKRTKNRLHLDLRTDDRPRDVQRFVDGGASVLIAYEHHTVMLDPEGNEFCVVEPF